VVVLNRLGMAITVRLWAASFNIGLSSLLFGYCLACLNTVITTGDSKNAEDCYTGADGTCPPGSILTDLNISKREWSQGGSRVGRSLRCCQCWASCLGFVCANCRGFGAGDGDDHPRLDGRGALRLLSQ
jgi:hypothetical protein